MLGAYTFWDAMWTMIVFFAWIMFFTWVVMLMVDNFRRTDHGGGPRRDGSSSSSSSPSSAPSPTRSFGPSRPPTTATRPAVSYAAHRPHLDGRRARAAERAPHRGRHQRTRSIEHLKASRRSQPPDQRRGTPRTRGVPPSGGRRACAAATGLRPWPAAIGPAGLMRGRLGDADARGRRVVEPPRTARDRQSGRSHCVPQSALRHRGRRDRHDRRAGGLRQDDAAGPVGRARPPSGALDRPRAGGRRSESSSSRGSTR